MPNAPAQPITASNPNVLVTSDPSIQADKKNSKLLHILLILLVCISLVALGISIVIALNKIEQYKADADKAQAEANATKHVTPTAVVKNVEVVEQKEDDNFLMFTLRSSPAGADVYQDGLFIGKTPIENKKMKKSSEPSQFVIALSGYELERKSFALDDTYSGSEFITLTKEVVRQVAANPATSAAQNNGGEVMANDAVVITTTHGNAPARHKKDHKANNPAPVDTGIVLPQ